MFWLDCSCRGFARLSQVFTYYIHCIYIIYNIVLPNLARLLAEVLCDHQNHSLSFSALLLLTQDIDLVRDRARQKDKGKDKNKDREIKT